MTYTAATTAEVRQVTGCSPGARALSAELRSRYRLPAPIVDLGCYARRPIRGTTSSWSVHAVGRATDLAFATMPQGNLIVVKLWSCMAALGLQLILWNGQSWRPGVWPVKYTGPAITHQLTLPHDYQGPLPAGFHAHAELTPAAARGPFRGWRNGLSRPLIAEVLTS